MPRDGDCPAVPAQSIVGPSRADSAGDRAVECVWSICVANEGVVPTAEPLISGR